MKAPLLNDKSYKNCFFLMFLLLLLFCSSQLAAQPSKWKNPTQVWVTYNDGSRMSGWMHDVKDSSILFVTKHPISYSSQRFIEQNPNIQLKKTEFTEALAKDIKHIKLQRRGAMLRGALIGAAIGAGIGIITGYASGDDEPGWFSFTKEEKAAVLGVGFAIPGVIIGGIVGAVHIKIPIGSQAGYQHNKGRITRHMIQP